MMKGYPLQVSLELTEETGCVSVGCARSSFTLAHSRFHRLPGLMSFVEVVFLDWKQLRKQHGMCVVKQLPVNRWQQ